MKDSVVEEIGTHDELLKKGGGYARIYELQAQAFLP
jgi:ABC-type multidrug transport system fused ATPase/permease subunit